MRKRFLRWLFDWVVRILAHRQVEGMENVPESGPYIIVGNHMSVSDIPLAYSVLGGPDLIGWAASKHRRHPVFGPVVWLSGGIFIRRGKVDREALNAAADWLKKGKVFALAPEGTRSRTGSLLRGKTGAAYIAHLTDAPIVPTAATGTETTFAEFRRLRRPRLTLHIGKPFRLPPIDENDRNNGLRRNADEIMCRIAALLPERYWGYYQDHPRLKELLRTSS
jgi:1-acyl-sn-glycerol-3-phosphate acyltransferase